MIIYLYGFLVGFFIAITGSWKDTLFEKFEILKFFRSPIITELWYLILLQRYAGRPLLLILLSSAAAERLTVEAYKAIRRQPPGKFQSATKDRGWLLDRLRPNGGREKGMLQKGEKVKVIIGGLAGETGVFVDKSSFGTCCVKLDKNGAIYPFLESELTRKEIGDMEPRSG